MKRDKVWFWASFRINDVANEAPIFVNKNAFNPNAWLYDPDTAQPGVNRGEQVNSSIRVTWQANPKNKIAGTYKADKWCNCPSQMSATVAPEAARDRRFPRLRQEHAEWTSPVTNKLLFEVVGMHLYERWGDMHLRVVNRLDHRGAGSHPVADDRRDRAEHRSRLPRPRPLLQQHRRAQPGAPGWRRPTSPARTRSRSAGTTPPATWMNRCTS